MKFEDFFEQCRDKMLNGISNDEFNKALMEIIIDAQKVKITEEVMTPYDMLKILAEGLNDALESVLDASIEAKKTAPTLTEFTFVLNPVIKGKVKRHVLFSVVQDSSQKFLVIYKDKKYTTQKSFDKLLIRIQGEETTQNLLEHLMNLAD